MVTNLRESLYGDREVAVVLIDKLQKQVLGEGIRLEASIVGPVEGRNFSLMGLI